MTEDVDRAKLKEMEEMVEDDMQEFQGESEKRFILIRLYRSFQRNFLIIDHIEEFRG